MMETMHAAMFTRFVAIGDSQTEGLWDGDDSVGVVGYADRLASMIDAHHPGLLYANLAVRGAMIRDVLAKQLDHALSLQPDLICACAGMNDVLWPGRSFDRALRDVNYMYDRLAESGAAVLTTTFPDIKDRFPTARIQAARVMRLNAVIRAAAARYGFALVELDKAASMRLPDTWSPDRMHGSSTGHARFAAAAAEALNLPGSNHDWAHAATGADEHVFGTGPLTQLFLGYLMMAPVLMVAGPAWRLLHGRPIRAKQPQPKHSQLGPVTARHDHPLA
jgi:lysophospholipase L1-like esterase